MQGTFTIADPVRAGRIRTGSQRRYIVVRWSDYPTPAAGRWIIAHRTDVAARAIGRALRGDHVIDTVTGETIR